MTRADLDQWLAEHDDVEVTVLPPEFDVAIVGLAERGSEFCVAYDLGRVYAVLEDVQHMSPIDARDWYGFNMSSGGEGDPIFVDFGHELPLSEQPTPKPTKKTLRKSR